MTTKKDLFTSPAVVQKISHFEAQTGHELIVVAAQSSDPYPGAQWRGGVLIGLFFSGIVLYFFSLYPKFLELTVVAAFIYGSAVFLRLTRLHRFFVLRGEAERESGEKAAALFSQFQSTTLGHQAAILLFISIQEHKIHLLIDRDLQSKIAPTDLHEILTCLRMYFKQGDIQLGLEKSIEILEQKVLDKVGKNPNPPALQVADRIFWLD